MLDSDSRVVAWATLRRVAQLGCWVTRRRNSWRKELSTAVQADPDVNREKGR